MKSIAVISKRILPSLISKEQRIFVSHSWVISEQTAKDLIGGQFSCHDKQVNDSFHQGTIIDVVPSLKDVGRYEIIYQWDNKPVSGRGLNWAMEQAQY